MLGFWGVEHLHPFVQEVVEVPELYWYSIYFSPDDPSTDLAWQQTGVDGTGLSYQWAGSG